MATAAVVVVVNRSVVPPHRGLGLGVRPVRPSVRPPAPTAPGPVRRFAPTAAPWLQIPCGRKVTSLTMTTTTATTAASSRGLLPRPLGGGRRPARQGPRAPKEEGAPPRPHREARKEPLTVTEAFAAARCALLPPLLLLLLLPLLLLTATAQGGRRPPDTARGGRGWGREAGGGQEDFPGAPAAPDRARRSAARGRGHRFSATAPIRRGRK